MARIVGLIVLGALLLLGSPIVAQTPKGMICGMIAGTALFLGGMILLGADEVTRAVLKRP